MTTTDHIYPGQTWRSLDPRDEGLTVTVVIVADEYVVIDRFRKSTVRRDRFEKAYAPVVLGSSREAD